MVEESIGERDFVEGLKLTLYKRFGKELQFKKYLHGLSDAGTRLLSVKSWVGIRVRKSVCCAGMSVRVLVIHCGIVQHRSIRAQFLLKFQASLGGSYARFEALDKSSFVLGNELWEEHFESLLALVKAHIIEIWEGKILGYMVMPNVLNNPVLTLQLGNLGILLRLMGRIVKGSVRKVSLAHVSCMTLFMLCLHQWVHGRWPWCYGSTSSSIILNLSTWLSHNSSWPPAIFLYTSLLCSILALTSASHHLAALPHSNIIIFSPTTSLATSLTMLSQSVNTFITSPTMPLATLLLMLSENRLTSASI